MKKQPPFPIAMTFSRRVRERRLALELTQAQLADRAAVTVETVARIERSIRDRDSSNTNPSLETMEKLAVSLGVHLKDLLTDPANRFHSKQSEDPSLAFIASLPSDVRRRVYAVARALSRAG